MKRRDFLKTAAVAASTVGVAAVADAVSEADVITEADDSVEAGVITEAKIISESDRVIQAWMNSLPSKDDRRFGGTRGWFLSRFNLAQALLHPFSLFKHKGTVIKNDHWICVRDIIFDIPIDAAPDMWSTQQTWDRTIPYSKQDEVSEKVTRIIGEGLVCPGAKIVEIVRTKTPKDGEVFNAPFVELKLTVIFPREVLAGTIFDWVI